MQLSADTKVVIAGALAAAAVLWWVGRKLANPGDTAAGIGAGIVSGVAGAASGVIGEAGNVAGDIVGLPRTSQTACEAAKASGSAWDASFACPAGEWISWMWNGRPTGRGASGGW